MAVLVVLICFFFCVKQKTAYEMRISDWSSDVCSSDLIVGAGLDGEPGRDLGAIAGLDGDFGGAGRSRAPPTVGGEGGGKGYAEFVLGAAGNPAAELEATAGEAVEHVEAVACRAEPCEGVDEAMVVSSEETRAELQAIMR